MDEPGKTPETAFPLRVLSSKIEGWINRLGEVWVLGQLTEINVRRGWVYLTLRDTLAEMVLQVSATSTIFDSAGPLADGAEVVVHGRISWWTKAGRLSLQADEIRPVGVGRLLAQLEQRKNLLRAEGLFDSTRKRRLPLLPRAIGLVTGANTAAEADVLTNVHRRWPAARFVTAHALMQGPRCVPEVIEAVARLDSLPDVDIIVIARGGGSLEDLLPFSDENLVRAVSAARTPIVSAIGHDVDTPLLDLVADWRASTPTDAAKRIVPDAEEERRRIEQARTRTANALRSTLMHEEQRILTLRSRPVMQDPSVSILAHRSRLESEVERLRHGATVAIREQRIGVDAALARVRAMSPKATLERGYAILVDDGASVGATTDTAVGHSLLAYVADGQLELHVDAVHPHQRKDTDD